MTTRDHSTTNRFAPNATNIFRIALAVFVILTNAQAAEKVIFHFNQTGGSQPLTGLISDSAGNLYGTASLGGLKSCSFNCGLVFELSPGSGGGWSESILFSFTGEVSGYFPYGTLIFDKQGNLYGLAQNGNLTATGVLFELTKGSNGTWSEKLVHTFDTTEGAPNGDLALDTAGNFYGSTQHGGTSSNGEIFELSPQSGETWTESIIYSFATADGFGGPDAGVSFDSAGNLYGPVYYDKAGAGGVYEASLQTNGQWTVKIIYVFGGDDGQNPNSKITLDANGNLFGTTSNGGPRQVGNVYELSPGSGGNWTEKSIHAFAAGNDGVRPKSSLVFDADGNLYGTSALGGNGCNIYGPGCGIVYRLTPQADGTWKEAIVREFESADDGSQPQGGVLIDHAGMRLFGTTQFGGGRYGYGAIFEISK